MEHRTYEGRPRVPRSECSDLERMAAACKLRRLWRDGVPNDLSPDDILVIGLLVDLSSTSTVALADERLGGALQAVFAQTEEFKSVTVGAPAGREATLHLISLEGTEPIDDQDVCLAYGLRHALPITSSRHDDAARKWLIPLAFLAPALWQSGLAFVSANRREELPPALGALVALLRSDWLDPLKLYEQQHRSASAAADRVIDQTTADLQAEIARLQLRIRNLEQAGLVRHELELAKAVAREGPFF